jgi:RNA polymerase sigma-B factor
VSPTELTETTETFQVEHYDLFAAYRRTGDRDLRNQIVERYRGLVEFTVRRFPDHGAERDDLRQVAFLGMVGAADRFDPDRGIQFSTFASRSMEGEIKRYLRDKTWSVRPPRRSQELHLELRRAEDELVQRLGREPTVAELASELGVTEDDVVLAMEARHAHRASSVDRTAEHAGAVLSDPEGLSGFALVEATDEVACLLETLPERDRELLTLRYLMGLNQTQTAERLGVSQSYLSRMLRRTLDRVRAGELNRRSRNLV